MRAPGRQRPGATQQLDPLRSAPSIGAQESTEALLPDHFGVVIRGSGARLDEAVAEALVVALKMVVLEVLAENVPEMGHAQRDDVIEALLADGAHESFRVGVEVRASSGESDDVDPGVFEKSAKAVVKTGSRSRMRKRLRVRNPSISSRRFRPICIIHRPPGSWMTPAM